MLRTTILPAAAALACLAASNVTLAQQSGGAAASNNARVVSTSPDYSKSMQNLQRAAQRLRESIQALAQQQPGPQRDHALRRAHQALYDAQQAMIQLPPELRNAPPVRSGGVAPAYAESFEKLQQAANRLYDAMHAMAKQPAGERRNDAMQQARESLFETEQALLALPNVTATGATTSGASTSTARESKSAAAAPPLVVVFPAMTAVNDKFSNGCWARFYGDQNYRGDTLTVAGPGDFAYLQTNHANLVRKWDSVAVGPKATLTAYDNENFTQPVASFKPGQSVTDLDDKLGLFENVRSLRLSCKA